MIEVKEQTSYGLIDIVTPVSTFYLELTLM